MNANVPGALNKQKRNGQGIVEYALILVLITVVVIVILAVLIGNRGSDTVRPASTIAEASLGRELVFPEGWELVTSYAYTLGDSYSVNTVYICRSTDTDEYRECAPQVGS